MRKTTTGTLPDDVQALYELTEPLEGGPQFALPHYGETEVDFRSISLAQAEHLVYRGFPYLRKRSVPLSAEKSKPKSGETAGPAG